MLILALLDLQFELALLLLPLVIVAEALITVPLDLVLKLSNLRVQHLVLLRQLVNILGEGQVALLRLDKIGDELVDVLRAGRLKDFLESGLVLD